MVPQRVWSLVLHFINEEPGATTSSKTHSWTGDINCVNPSTFLLAEWQPGRQGWKLKSYQDSPEMRIWASNPDKWKLAGLTWVPKWVSVIHSKGQEAKPSDKQAQADQVKKVSQTKGIQVRGLGMARRQGGRSAKDWPSAPQAFKSQLSGAAAYKLDSCLNSWLHQIHNQLQTA